MLVFATLGPSGSNHELVSRQYLDFHGLLDAKLCLVADFDLAVAALRAGQVDYIIQCAVHPATAWVLGRHFREMFVIDTFISPSKPLGVLTRRDVAVPRSLALQPATRDYVDTSRWSRLVPEQSIATVAQALLEGRVDSGITAIEYAERHSDTLRVDAMIGSPDDAWIVYGRERVYRDRLVAWPDSPAARLFKAAGRPA
jgi:hypothetical protein